MKLREFEKFIFIGLLIGLLPPGSIFELPALHGFHVAFLVHLIQMSCYCVMLIVIASRGSVLVSPFLASFALYRAAYMLADLYNHDNPFLSFYHMCALLLLCVYISEVYRFGNHRKLLFIIRRLMTAYIIINFISILLFPKGYKNALGWNLNFFLGYKNSFINYFLLWYASVAFSQRPKKAGVWRGIANGAVFAIGVISIFLMRASTALGICGVLILYHAGRFLFRQNFEKIFLWAVSIKTIALSTITISFLLVSLPIWQNFAAIFGKDGTFSHRMDVWLYAIQHISVLGNGNVEFALSWDWVVMQAHNKVFDVLFYGGIVMLIVFLFMILQLSMVCDKIKDKNLSLSVHALSLCYAVLFLMESSRFNFPQCLALALIYNSSKYEAGDRREFLPGFPRLSGNRRHAVREGESSR